MDFTTEVISQSASTLNQLVTILLITPYFEEIIRKYLKNKYERDEFRQFICVEILESNSGKTLSIYNKGQFRWWISRIVDNNIKSNSSRWYNQFKENNNVEYFDYMNKNIIDAGYYELQSEEDIENINAQKLIDIENELKNIYNNNPKDITGIKLFRLYYYDKLNYNKISQRTKIPLSSVSYYIKEILNKIKLKLNNKPYN